MRKRDLDLKTLFDIPLWESVQDQLAKLTGTSIVTVDFKGNPVTRHSCRTEFCGVMRENPTFRKRCFRCDALAGLEAVRMGKPYIYLCHGGIVDGAVPVLVGDKYLGAVMFGQVRIAGSDSARVKRLVSEVSVFQAEDCSSQPELQEMYERLPEMDYERVEAIAEAISAIVRYIVDRAVLRHNETLTWEWLLHSGAEQAGAAPGGREPPGEEQEPPESAAADIPQSSPIYPAVVYVQTHRQEAVIMKDMAALCHLSPSYFSRLFGREMGENFTVWVNRQKILWAKEMLRSSNASISQIAADLGFMDSSYFINVFKRFEGVTPLAYRQGKY